MYKFFSLTFIFCLSNNIFCGSNNEKTLFDDINEDCNNQNNIVYDISDEVKDKMVNIVDNFKKDIQPSKSVNIKENKNNSKNNDISNIKYLTKINRENIHFKIRNLRFDVLKKYYKNIKDVKKEISILKDEYEDCLKTFDEFDKKIKELILFLEKNALGFFIISSNIEIKYKDINIRNRKKYSDIIIDDPEYLDILQKIKNKLQNKFFSQKDSFVMIKYDNKYYYFVFYDDLFWDYLCYKINKCVSNVNTIKILSNLLKDIPKDDIKSYGI